MKIKFFILAVAMLVVSGCGSAPTATPTHVPTTPEVYNPQVMCNYLRAVSMGEPAKANEAEIQCATLAVATYGPSPTPSQTPVVTPEPTDANCANFAATKVAPFPANEARTHDLATQEYIFCMRFGTEVPTATPKVTVTPDDCLKAVSPNGGWPVVQDPISEPTNAMLNEINKKYLTCRLYGFSALTPTPTPTPR